MGAFKVKIQSDGWGNGGAWLRFTLDGFRKTEIHLATIDQVEKTIAVLQGWLNNKSVTQESEEAHDE
jgi:hypothetical protein